jgi:hypothetical protein
MSAGGFGLMESRLKRSTGPVRGGEIGVAAAGVGEHGPDGVMRLPVTACRREAVSCAARIIGTNEAMSLGSGLICTAAMIWSAVTAS